MTDRTAALYDAIDLALRDADDQVLWLKPRDRQKFRRNDAQPWFSARLGRATAAVGVGLFLNLSSAETAFAPATAHAAADLSKLESLGASILPVEAAPIRVTIEGDAPLGAEALGLRTEAPAAEPTDADLARVLGDMDDDLSERDPNEVLGFGSMKIPRRIVETILRAAQVTGVDPVYMMALADKESSFSPEVRARTSSAEGLFQFVTKTWLNVVREHGSKHGLEAEAAAVTLVDGDPAIADDEVRERVLGLRRDPYLSALMAAEMLKCDRTKIEKRIGRDLTRSELYLAHFLGADSARRFVEILSGKPRQSARRVFPQAARANRALFFARKGRRTRDLTVAEVYAKIERMIDKRLGRYNDVTAMAEVQPASQL